MGYAIMLLYVTATVRLNGSSTYPLHIRLLNVLSAFREGFPFQYDTLEKALDEIAGRRSR